MKCQAIQQLLPLFVEGDLPRRKDQRVRRHLEDCLACRGLQEQYRTSQQWLRASAQPAVAGQRLEALRRTVWRRIEREPRPSPLWLALERAWVALRRWASQPAVAVAAVGMVVLVSVTMTRGLGGSRLGPQLDLQNQVELVEVTNEGAEVPDDPEALLAAATPEEMAEGTETGEATGLDGTEESVASNMRIEIQTQDPNVRIIWFTPAAAESAAPEKDN
jgi:hypothetical protein